jgi:hypothetical protein
MSACALGLAALSIGCKPIEEQDDGGSSETGPDAPHTTLLVNVLPSVCDDPVVVQVQVRARRVGCAEPGPCTLPATPREVLGDVATCPITEERLLAVDIEDSGRYLVDTVADRTPDPPTYECYAVKAGDPDVLVTTIDLEAREERMLVALGAECPEPG